MNRERKLQQTAAGQELATLEAEWQVTPMHMSCAPLLKHQNCHSAIPWFRPTLLFPKLYVDVLLAACWHRS